MLNSIDKTGHIHANVPMEVGMATDIAAPGLQFSSGKIRSRKSLICWVAQCTDTELYEDLRLLSNTVVEVSMRLCIIPLFYSSY